MESWHSAKAQCGWEELRVTTCAMSACSEEGAPYTVSAPPSSPGGLPSAACRSQSLAVQVARGNKGSCKQHSGRTGWQWCAQHTHPHTHTHTRHTPTHLHLCAHTRGSCRSSVKQCPVVPLGSIVDTVPKTHSTAGRQLHITHTTQQPNAPPHQHP